MRLTAPVGIVASLRDEGVVFPDSWPRPCVCDVDGQTTELAVTLAGTVADRVDVIPLPRIADVIAEAIEGWWGAHGWGYPHAQMILHVDRIGQPINGWPISHLSTVIERSCAEFRSASWKWCLDADSEPTGLRWTTGAVEVAFVLGKRLHITYRDQLSTPSTPSPPIVRARDEEVLLIDETHDSENILVWLRYPTDVGTTANEILAGTSPVGMLPRCVLVPRARVAG
jgi:hypothetical protein